MKLENILIVYFSGTGGTKRAADALGDSFEGKGFVVNMFALDLSINKSFDKSYEEVIDADKVFLLYPVHAFDAPTPVYEWIKKLPTKIGTSMGVISVSAGGEIGINSTSRTYVIKALKNKGYDVFYEKMLVMPSNFVAAASDELNRHLLNIIPIKTDKIVNDVINDVRIIKKVKPSAILAKFISCMEKKFSFMFSKSLKAYKECNACGWCVRSCPRNNIKMKDGKISFNNKCIICMRCLYGCPQDAIKTKIFNFTVLKGGFDLSKIDKEITEESIKSFDANRNWKSVVKYVLEDD